MIIIILLINIFCYYHFFCIIIITNRAFDCFGLNTFIGSNNKHKLYNWLFSYSGKNTSTILHKSLVGFWRFLHVKNIKIIYNIPVVYGHSSS